MEMSIQQLLKSSVLIFEKKFFSNIQPCMFFQTYSPVPTNPTDFHSSRQDLLTKTVEVTSKLCPEKSDIAKETGMYSRPATDV